MEGYIRENWGWVLGRILEKLEKKYWMIGKNYRMFGK